MISSIDQLNLIAFHGLPGSGKDTASEYLQKTRENTYGESFAGPLKRAAAKLWGIPISYFEDRNIKEESNYYWDMSPRQMAQYFGTELVRAHLSHDHWIKHLEGRLLGELCSEDWDEPSIYDSGDTVVISDLRFQNEYEWVIKHGGIVIHLVRPEAVPVGIANHPSNASITFSATERTYHLNNNRTFEDLYGAIDGILQSAKMYIARVSQNELRL